MAPEQLTQRPVFFFDLAGVLLKWDASPVYDALFADSPSRKKTFFTEILDTATLNRIATGGKSVDVLSQRALECPDYAEALRAFWSRWNEMISDAFPDTVALGRELRTLGYQTHLLGNWSRDEFDRATQRFGFLKEFHSAIISGDHGFMKPDARLFKTALRQHSLAANECVFIDDTKANVKAAGDLGFTAIHFTNAESLRVRLVHLGILEHV